MISPEDVAQAFHEAYERLAPAFGYRTRAESAVPWEQVPETNRTLMVAVAAEVLALIRPEVASMPVQRDERAEKLGERLDAMVAEVNASNRIIHHLEERVWRLEAEVAVDDTLLAERQRILDALPCPDHGPCVPYVLEWIEKARNAEALAANLKRLENDSAIELMRVKRELAVVKAALATRRGK